MITSVDLKQIDFQIFFEQRWVYSRSAENCCLVSVTKKTHIKVTEQLGKVNSYTGSWEGCSKQRIHGFSLAESLPGNKRSLLSIGLCYGSRAWQLPLPGSWTVFNWGLCVWMFNTAYSKKDLSRGIEIKLFLSRPLTLWTTYDLSI